MGALTTLELTRGKAALVHTGGMVPAGADAVVMVEDTQVSRPGEIEILRPAAPGMNVLQVGEDVQPGETVLLRGSRLRAQEIGGLMALGFTRVRVVRRPLVGILSTGDEVVAPEADPLPGQVRDVNTYTLAAVVTQAGGEPVLYGILPDRREALELAARQAHAACDVVLITAGSSVSTRDITSEIIATLGPPGVLAHGVALKPGKPTILAVCSGKPVIGLPGNPVSALVVAGLFVAPLLRRMLGLRAPRLSPRVHRAADDEHPLRGWPRGLRPGAGDGRGGLLRRRAGLRQVESDLHPRARGWPGPRPDRRQRAGRRGNGGGPAFLGAASMTDNVFLHDVPLAQAWDRLMMALTAAGLAGPLPGESIALEEALGRVTAEPIWARQSSPHYHASAMDGYALLAKSTRGANDRSPVELRVGDQAVYVDTGDPLPGWADAVVPIEDAEPIGDGRRATLLSIRLRAAVVPWSHVRPMGEDIVASELVLPAGHILRPVDLGALAGSGYADVLVRRRPRVAILPTGSELVAPGSPANAGQIIEFNSLVLGAQVRDWGGEPRPPDDCAG